jgi:hypothetical protein
VSELTGILGLVFLLAFLILIIIFTVTGRQHPTRYLRELPAFARLSRSIGRAVEAGERLHVTLGRGSLNGLQGPSALIGLVLLQRITRAASLSDRPPVATSGEGSLAILSRDTLRSAYRDLGIPEQYEPTSGQLTGVTPFSYAAGAIPVILDQQVTANVMAGHFGAEVALLTDAAERSGSLSLGGSDSLPAQAVLFATAHEPLIGEELYAGGAYTSSGPAHAASLRAQDVLRWVLIAAILGGALLKFLGVWQ